MLGRCICALGDFATACLTKTIPRFREEFQAHIDKKCCPFEKEYTKFK
jgi:NADH-quinone oxidoreductase subunit F